VPSRWLETGPLVVLEALAAGIPVAGSNLGGISEWIVDGKNGFLVEPTLTGWTQFIARLSNGIPPLSDTEPFSRTMANVAREMKTLYGEVLSGR
jgi:glycosyltransferase involved in cell wall biosynthesis